MKPQSPPFPGQPSAGDTPVFGAPWQARAFAMTLTLHEQGLFTWNEWAQMLAQQIARAQEEGDPDLGDTYYSHWLSALEALIARRGIAAVDTLDRARGAWAHAAERTPHGSPIELREGDFTDHPE